MRGAGAWRVAAGLVAGVATASLPRGAGPGVLAVGALVGAGLAAWAGRATPSGGPPGPAGPRRSLAGLVERVAPWLALGFLVPLVTLPVPPGADMAMHVALARALGAGAREVSPAWPDVAPLIYPRGLSGLVALAAPLGLARAGLLVSGLAYVLYAAGVAALFGSAGIARPWTLAVLAVLLAKVPQEMFAWGGIPTVLALALGLHAAAALRPPEGPVRQPALVTALLLAGAAAVHPMGALAGLLVTGGRALRHGPLAGLAGLAGLGLVLALLAAGGPALSPAEIEWVRDWGRTREALLRGAPWQFAWWIWPALWRALGPAWMIAVGGATLVLLGRGPRTPVGRALALVLGLGALLTLPRVVPALDGAVYPARLAPLFALAMAPVLGAALARLPPRGAGLAAVGLLAVALPLHLRWYQGAGPMATRADVRLLECVAARTGPDAILAGAYGDATQWAPALTGRRITLPHRHVSVLDETAPGLAALRPTHRLHGERPRYPAAFPGPAPPPEPATAPLCEAGRARLWALP
jgi:hypothetical protein